MYEHDPLTHTIIGRAIEVHRHLGPGLFESSYEEALCIELTDAKLPFTRQVCVRAQTLAYMRVLRLPVGLLMNFNSAVLRTSIQRFAI